MSEQSKIEVVEAIPVVRESARRDWLRSSGLLLAGAAATGAMTLGARRAGAQAVGTPATPGGEVPAAQDPANPNMGVDTAPASDMGKANTMAMKPAPDAPQDVPGASIVPSAGNPNNPAKTIPASAKTAAASDIDILNFALGLEYLEADFYTRVVEANTARPYLPPRVAQIAQTLAEDEVAHVTAILQIINGKGATPIAKPSFQFPAAVFISPIAFLNQAAAFEVTGVGAYLGAAPFVKSRDVLKFAASVYGIEARHTGVIRLLGGMTFSPSDTETPLTMAEVTERVRPYFIVA